MDHEQPADQKRQREPELGEVLHERGEPRPQVGVADVGPLQAVRRLGERSELPLLGHERLDDANPVDVLVDDRRHLGQARLDQP